MRNKTTRRGHAAYVAGAVAGAVVTWGFGYPLADAVLGCLAAIVVWLIGWQVFHLTRPEK